MSDGCWVQFWDDKGCMGATLRFDAQEGTLYVADLDDYTQSDGDKEGDEPDSLMTGTRAWLVVYKDDGFEGKQAMFGPNTKVDDLDLYGMGGNISSFRLYDTRPTGFVEATPGDPIAAETSTGVVDSQTVNNIFRTVTAAAFALIPRIGGAISGLVRGLWPDVDQKDQVWGSFQNYLNQLIAGVYWQITYESLNDILETLYKAASDFAETPDWEPIKKDNFKNLYELVNNYESFFVDVDAPEKRFYFLVPFATLRLATLRENLQHYAYYYGSEPSQAEIDILTTELRDSIALYQNLLSEGRDRILQRRDQMIYVDDETVIDSYNGKRMPMSMPDDLDSRRYYAEKVLNALALKLDEHIAVSQLWPHFDPAVTGPVEPPILDYVDGPTGYFWYGVANFSEMASDGRITAVTLWTIDGGNNPAEQNGLELSVDGDGLGRVGGEGGTASTLALAAGETVVAVEGTTDLRYLRFLSSTGADAAAGDPGREGSRFRFDPLPGTIDCRVVGVTGSAGYAPDEPSSFASVRAISVHWRCALPITAPSVELLE
ncbi:insecticidal delta-endotoxin Cry8Ea1 family protein [Salinarimonas rosea]|uniref:insecticidal delta-endotoxin Cry8Ea1 family protein n=1 Tax=Salinarimonas rosea TaxID=552063 RepID=UPI0012EBDF56|nr:insecticidal delta-endotoxin Cry8Ea1 family protein [Salinarimonas rosea]